MNVLTEAIRSSLRHLLLEAVTTLEDKVREVWIWDFPAQVALTASQISWNNEVTIAFQRLEEGYENAIKDLFRKQAILFVKIINLIDYMRPKTYTGLIKITYLHIYCI